MAATVTAYEAPNGASARAVMGEAVGRVRPRASNEHASRGMIRLITNARGATSAHVNSRRRASRVHLLQVREDAHTDGAALTPSGVPSS